MKNYKCTYLVRNTETTPDLTSANLTSVQWRTLSTEYERQEGAQQTNSSTYIHEDALSRSDHSLIWLPLEHYYPSPDVHKWGRTSPGPSHITLCAPLPCMHKRKVRQSPMHCTAETDHPQSLPGSDHDRLKRFRQDGDPCVSSEIPVNPSRELVTDVSMVREFLATLSPYQTGPLFRRY